MKSRQSSRFANFNSRLEILENRIAPATFLVTSTGLSILDSSGNDATGASNENAVEDLIFGNDAVVFLATGDKLYFDANGNLKADVKEILLTVSTGNAMAIFTDLDRDLRFSRREFTGLLTSGGFGGTVNGSV